MVNLALGPSHTCQCGRRHEIGDLLVLLASPSQARALHARRSHRPVTISEDGEPVAALINIDDLADLEDRAALAAHLADKIAGRDGISLDELDAALDRIDAATLS